MTLRRRLLALVIAAMLPAAGAIAWRGWTDTTNRTAEIHQTALVQSKLLASELARIIDGKRQLLLGLSKIRSVRENENPRCNNLLNEVHDAIEGTTFLAVFDAKAWSCAARSSSARAARRPFLCARSMPVVLPSANIRSDSSPDAPPCISLGDAERGGQSPGAGRWTKLQWLEQQLAERAMPHNAQVTVTDRNGTVLATAHGAPNNPGERIDESLMRNLMLPTAGAIDNRRSRSYRTHHPALRPC